MSLLFVVHTISQKMHMPINFENLVNRILFILSKWQVFLSTYKWILRPSRADFFMMLSRTQKLHLKKSKQPSHGKLLRSEERRVGKRVGVGGCRSMKRERWRGRRETIVKTRKRESEQTGSMDTSR